MPRLFPIHVAFTKRPFRFWIWAAVCYLLALLVLVTLIKLAFSGRELQAKAVEEGRIVSIELTTGTIEGGKDSSALIRMEPSHTESESAPTPPSAPSATHSPPPSPAQGNEGMAPVPLVSLIEQTDKGILPIAAQDGTLAWKYYARSYMPRQKRPVVAIILTNLGLSRTRTEDVLKLPPMLTLSFSPYASDIYQWASRARVAGFESMIDLPMQPENYPLSDPGPFGLMEDLSLSENMARMHTVMAQFTGYIGMLAPVNEKLTGNTGWIKPYLGELKKRGLMFLYLRNQKNAGLEELAKTNGFYVIGIDKAIDDEATRYAVETQLQALTDAAKTKGYAIGLGHSYPSTIEALRNWSQGLDSQGVDLVPVSAVAKGLLP